MEGSDLEYKWGISAEIRKTIPKLPDKKLERIPNLQRRRRCNSSSSSKTRYSYNFLSGNLGIVFLISALIPHLYSKSLPSINFTGKLW